MTDMDVYSSIFDVVGQNMHSAGGSFSVSKECYMNIARSNSYSVDILELSKEDDNSVFLEKAYSSLLKRLVDEKAVKNWESRFSLPKEEFQRLLVNSIMSSVEFNNAQVRVYNNIYSRKNAFGGNISSIQQSPGLNLPEKLLRFYRKQPGFLKKLEKKIMGVK